MSARRWLGPILVAGLAAVGCGDGTNPGDRITTDNSEETVLCVQHADTSSFTGTSEVAQSDEVSVVLWVESGGCISVANASCSATQNGDAVQIHSEVEFADSGESSCTLELRRSAVVCEGTVVASEGVMTFVHGDESLTLEVPGVTPMCP